MTPAPFPALTLPAGLALMKLVLQAGTPLAAFDLLAPQPTPGVWALMTPDCPAPTDLALETWPACAQPVGFDGERVSLLQRPQGANRAARTGKLFSVGDVRYLTASIPGDGGRALVQVEAPGLTGRSWIYLVLTPAPIDASGRFAEARLFPLTCPAGAAEGVARQGDRCRATTLGAVQGAALATAAPAGYDFTLRLVVAQDGALPTVTEAGIP